MLHRGREYLFYGKITEGMGGRELVNPQFADASKPPVIRPIYSQVAGLTTKNIESAMYYALNMLPEIIKDPIPQDILLTMIIFHMNRLCSMM